MDFLAAVMLVFALASDGQGYTMAIGYPSMIACEEARAEILAKVNAQQSEDGNTTTFAAAAVCVKPVEIKSI